MTVFCAIVQAFMRPAIQAGRHLACRGTIRSKLNSCIQNNYLRKKPKMEDNSLLVLC
jgi:hypothetical protein